MQLQSNLGLKTYASAVHLGGRFKVPDKRAEQPDTKKSKASLTLSSIQQAKSEHGRIEQGIAEQWVVKTLKSFPSIAPFYLRLYPIIQALTLVRA